MRTSRRRFAAVAAAVLGIGLSWSSIAAPAVAGGPTSVLLVSPDSGRTASLYATDPDYSVLAGLLGAAVDGDVPTEPSTADAEAQASGAGVTVTWLIHDVQVWRVDRIYPQAAGGPWVATQVSAGGPALTGDTPTTWHVVTRGKELEALLDRLGLDAAAAPPPSCRPPWRRWLTRPRRGCGEGCGVERGAATGRRYRPRRLHAPAHCTRRSPGRCRGGPDRLPPPSCHR